MMRFTHIVRRAALTSTLLGGFFFSAFGQVPVSMTGQIRDGSYGNPFFGLTYDPNPTLIFNASEFAGNKTWTERTFLLFSAWEKEEVGKVRMGVVADADRLSDYPEGRRGAEAYISRVTRNQLGQGYDVVSGQKQRQLGNAKFLEADFKRGEVSEAVLVTLRKGYALVFVFNAASPTDLDNLISSSRITFSNQPER